MPGSDYKDDANRGGFNRCREGELSKPWSRRHSPEFCRRGERLCCFQTLYRTD